MKILSNTSGLDTRFIKAVFTKVHAYMRTLENRKAPNWQNLRVKIEGRDMNYHSGRAFYNGNGYEWDLFLTLPRPVKRGTHWASEDKKGQRMNYMLHELVHIIYHELMHTYGYKHSQYSDITKRECLKLYPDNIAVPAAAAPAAKEKPPKWQTKLNALRNRQDAWQRKAKRAENALKKINTSIKYYERKYEKDSDNE